MEKHEALQAVLKWFTLMWIVTAIGLVIGQFVPPALMIPLVIIELGLIIAVSFVRKMRKMAKSVTLVFAGISGITLYPTLLHYVGDLGANTVLLVFLSISVLFTLYGLFGYKMSKDLSGWGKYLFIAVIGLVIVMLLSVFIPIGNIMMLGVSIVAVLVFSLYTIYDFNQIAHSDVTEETVPLIALGLYLDFINLFLHALRIVSYFKD